MIPALFTAVLPILGKVLDRVIPDPVAREQARAELFSAQAQADLAELQVTLSAIVAEAQSTDPWTSRARPTFLYVMYLVILLCAVGAVIGIWWPDQVTTASQNLTNLLGAIPDQMWWLFGAGYLGYSATRSFDKWKGGAK